MLDFVIDGAEHHPAAATALLPDLLEILKSLPQDRAGIRITGIAGLSPLLAPAGAIGKIAAQKLGPHIRAVRAILFDKSPEANWSLQWHQDRTICVKQRVDVPGFGPWTIKQGLPHVEPPFALIDRMLTLRVHLDDVPPGNAPLLIAPGSHRRARIAEGLIASVVKECGSYACLAKAGDVWLYATAILHASEATSIAARRRVLQVDFSAEFLPDGLEWMGV